MAAETHRWSSYYAFIAASIGTAVGIANIWKFTYVAGANGGGMFVLIYILSLAFVAIPALLAEMMIGQRGGRSVVGTMKVLHEREGISKYWELYGVLALLAVFIVLSFYSVISGWTIDYFVLSLRGAFTDIDGGGTLAMFEELQGDPGRMVLYQSLFLILTVGTVAVGLRNGVERIVGSLTPTLFVLILVLLAYSVFYADFARGVAFLLQPDVSSLNGTVVLMAMGQAFFSLGVGVGVMMTVGAYSNTSISIGKATVIIGAADAIVAILAGLAIFPIVFQYGLTPSEGPSLMFLTLPVAFGQMPGGAVLGPLFFLLLSLAALTSTIVIFEAVVAWLEEYSNWPRKWLAVTAGFAIWIAGFATVFSFNIWSHIKPLRALEAFANKTIFDLLDYFVSNLLMPLGGIVVCIMAAWVLPAASVREASGIANQNFFNIWKWLVRIVAPLAIGLVFLVNLV
ncbi:MAG: sodium-dependent transporter [Woeseiaceae bacterium]|nr:sodium-dependent transporter [Woeseiaceae bacterium]